MPFYEYECTSCKYYTEVLQKVSDPPMTKCPSCGKKTFKKLVSAPVFRLKGSGWYETDFKSDKENKRNLAERDEAKPDDKDRKDAAAKPDTPKGEASKAETAKPAAKSEGGKPAARPRRATASKAKAPSKAPAKAGAARKKSRR